MNDRHLFRAKRTDNGEWVKGYLYRLSENHPPFIMLSARCGESYAVEPSTICQCTGLKDKNGKLIWENDIMCGHLDVNFPEDITYTRVLWHNNGFCTNEHDSVDFEPLDDFEQEHFEVCGNIFDNPELLEVGE